MKENSFEDPPSEKIDYEDCFFYHTIEIPGKGLVEGISDMRPAVPVLFDTVDFKNKKVIEVGPAGGFLSFEMEKRGANVTSVELGQNDRWDIVPHASIDIDRTEESYREHLTQLRNSYWFAHRQLNSNSKVVHGSCYQIEKLGLKANIGLFSNLLVHLRDPLRAIQSMANSVSDTMILCDAEPYSESRLRSPLRYLARFVPYAQFIPKPNDKLNTHTWWHLSPILISNYLKVLGFTNVKLSYFKSGLTKGHIKQWAIVAKRESIA